jgi:hypothetical protein
VDTQLKRFEVQPAGSHNHDLTIQHATLRKLRSERLEELGIITGERLLVPALDEYLVAIPKHERSETVPFRFKDPISIGGELTDCFGEHRQDRWIYRKMHVERPEKVKRVTVQ